MNEPRSVVVTGGGRGIGAALTARLLACGWEVVILERDTKAMELVNPSSDNVGRLRIVEGDATDRRSLDEACLAATSLAPLRGFVANAGYNRPGASATLSRDDWDEVLEINLSAVHEAAQSAFAHRDRSGLAIVALSSFAALRGLPGRAAYGAAKAGIGGLVRTLATEWGPLGVRVNAVAPGFVETRLVADAFANRTIDPAAVLERIPMGRMAVPSEIATVIAFLLSPDASYVSGVTLPVDGAAAAQGLPG